MVSEEENSRRGGFIGGWTMSAKPCDSCKSASALLFCRADSAFLCISCDSNIHTANKLASRHERVWMCEVCEQAPASVTCKADAASLCVTCDRDIHSANPLARRHERIPVVPFYESAVSAVKSSAINFLVPDGDNHLLKPSDEDDDDVETIREEEAEAASWLLQNPNPKLMEAHPDLKTGGGGDYFFSEVDPYLDLDYPEIGGRFQNQNGSGSDSVVPVQTEPIQVPLFHPTSENHCIDFDFTRSKPSYSYNTHSLSQSVSSSSMDVGVVPDGNCNSMADISNPFVMNLKNGIDQFNNGTTNNMAATANQQACQLSGLDREARVLRYREKRKNRKFEKTIRYASRKAYAETRPRIKGRFAKRTEIEAEVDRIYSSAAALMVDSGYGIVPSF